MKVLENVVKLMKEGYVCDHCLGRSVGNLLTGMSNEERGKIIRKVLAFIYDSGEDLDIDLSNFSRVNLRNRKINAEKKKCWVCGGLFDHLDEIAKRAIDKISKYEFKTYLVGCKLSDDLANKQDKFFEIVGADFSENIKSEINREIGKIIEKEMKKKMDRKNPDIVITVDLKTNTIRTQVKSLFVYGEYQKLARGIPQATWYCPYCHGKGCVHCHGTGLLHPTSVQMIIEKPFLKLLRAKKSKFHAAGREDIDARCLAWRPFVIELVKPKKRKLNLREVTKQINKSKKVKVRKLKILKEGKEMVRYLKSAKFDKTYRLVVEFEKPIDKEKLKKLKGLEGATIKQATPLRVVHRRADKIRRRKVRKIRWKLLSKKKLEILVTTESGLYVKELVTGDNGRTAPNVADTIENKPKKILLDVVKIHTKI